MRRVMFVCALVAMVSCPQWAGSQGQDAVANFMRQKLEHSQKVLEGLALENFPMIVKNAKELNSLGRTAKWHVLQTPEYAQYSAEFVRLTEKLGKMGRDKNTEGATLAYVELTMNCVNCHKHVRKIRAVSIGQLPSALGN